MPVASSHRALGSTVAPRTGTEIYRCAGQAAKLALTELIWGLEANAGEAALLLVLHCAL